MKKKMLLCMVIVFFPVSVMAQAGGRPLKSLMLDYDTTLTVKCSYNTLSVLSPYATHHRAPRNDDMVTLTCGQYHHTHECVSENAVAQRIFLARWEQLDNPDIYRHPLSDQVAKIVHNFELLTGIRNSGDGDFIGWCYISHLTRSGWKLWYNENKESLAYCPVYHVLYLQRR